MVNKITHIMSIELTVKRLLSIIATDKDILMGEESSWHESEKKVDSWNMDDPNMPDWLNKYV